MVMHPMASAKHQPGGFNVFVLSPLSANRHFDQKIRVLQVRSMFGSTELDEESIKHFAKNDFCLANNVAGLEMQICTCIKCLEKLAFKNGVASEGRWHGFKMLSMCEREFLGLTQMGAPLGQGISKLCAGPR